MSPSSWCVPPPRAKWALVCRSLHRHLKAALALQCPSRAFFAVFASLSTPDPDAAHKTQRPPQACFSVLIFIMLASEDGFKEVGLRNGTFSTVAFIIGAAASIVSGYLGMMIATYANARTALQARKGVAPAFMCGETAPRFGAVHGGGDGGAVSGRWRAVARARRCCRCGGRAWLQGAACAAHHHFLSTCARPSILTPTPTQHTHTHTMSPLAFRSGAVMGFLLTSLALLTLYVLLFVYRKVQRCCSQLVAAWAC